MVSGRVTEFWRFPVKSMAGERVDRLELDSDGVVGDRRFAVRDAESGLIASAKRPGRWGVLLACRAATAADGSVLVTMPEGPTFPAGDPSLDTALSELTGQRVTFEHIDGRSADESGDYEAEYPELDQRPSPGADGVPDRDADRRPLVRRSLCRPPDDDVDDRSRRCSIGGRRCLQQSVPAEHRRRQDDWAGAKIRVGPSATLQRVIRAPRCIMTSVEQPGLARDHRILQAIARENRMDSEWLGPLPCAGLFAEVHVPGTVSSGDALTIERAAN